ncbi:sensor histidine kinase [Tessaracoccus sp.]
MSPTSLPLRRRTRASRIWGLFWRMLLITVLGLVGFFAIWMDIDASLIAAGGSLEDHAGLLVLDLLLGAAAIALYPLRRRKPLLVVGLMVACTSLSSLALPAAALGIISLSTRRRRGEMAGVSVIFLVSMLVNLLSFPVSEPLAWWLTMLLAAGLCAALLLIGLYIGGRRQLVEVLRDRAEQTQREHAADMDRARMAERTRIAREMHDALAHRLSLVSLHAGALEYRTDLSPEDVRVTAGIVRENARLASTDLREVLGVLRDLDDASARDTTRPPVSPIDAVEDLVQDSRGAGNPTSLAIDARTRASLDTLPIPVQAHLRRVVQEALTNTRKHAPGEPTQVHLGGVAGERLSVRVINRLPSVPTTDDPLPSGFGLTGLHERVRISGGELRTSRSNGSFVLEAWFPWTQ